MNPLYYSMFIEPNLSGVDYIMAIFFGIILAFGGMYFATVAFLSARDKITELREKFRGRK